MNSIYNNFALLNLPTNFAHKMAPTAVCATAELQNHYSHKEANGKKIYSPLNLSFFTPFLTLLEEF